MEERISELQDSSIEITKTETQREENLKKKKKSIEDQWENIKKSNIRIIEILEGKQNGIK